LTDHGGAISANVLDFDHEASTPASLLKFTGTVWDADYRAYCAAHDLPAHPARMQAGLVSFFINFLTNKGDLIFDPFGGSNTTGAVAEQLERRWITVEAEPKYVAGSKGRFEEFRLSDDDPGEEDADKGE
jgi:site-specific DNA-methyltransferase (cytosine-N4-specific)